MPRENLERLAVFASGRGSNLEAIIAASEAGWLGMTIALVLSDVPGARALDLARSKGIPVETIPFDEAAGREAFGEALAGACKGHGVTVVALAGFMRILPESFLTQYPDRVFNIHPSLLPAFPGLHAQAQALDYGVKVTGCTVHLVDAGIDTGPVVMQAAVPVLPGDDVRTLSERILVQEHRLYPRVLSLWAAARIRIEDRRVWIDDAR